MSITFKPAERKNVPLLIGLDGASGSGKTYSALELASGIADEIGRTQGREGKIFAIDTERGRMLHYADFFKFLHGEISPPFTPQAYLDALTACERGGADVVVVDSFSHEWEGEGGVREWADKLEAGGTRSPANWKEPKLAHKRLVNKMLAMRPHIIVCMRAEEKMRVENVLQWNEDGSPKMYNGKQSAKMVITPAAELAVEARWVPICEKRFPFEITTSLLLTPSDPGVPIPRKLQKQHRPFFPEGKPISRDAGRALAMWAMGGTAAAINPPPSGAGDQFTVDDARTALTTAAGQGTAALETEWRRKPIAPYRDQLQAHLDGLKATAAAVDQRDRPLPELADQGAGHGEYDGA